MNLQKFTIKAQEAVQEAALCAQRQGQQAIEPEHLLNSILKVGEQVTQFIFQKLGVNPKAVAHTLEAQIGSLPRVQGGEPYLSRTTHEVLLKAEDFAHKAGDEFITLEHILLALLKVNSTASKILKDAGVTEKELQAAIKELRGKGLMIGIELNEGFTTLRNRLLFEKHIFTGGAGANVIRLLPPLCITREIADRFIAAFTELENQ